MVPILVPAMAPGGVGAPSLEKLHPFFAKGTGNDLPCASSANRNSGRARGTAAENPVPGSADEDLRKKRRKADTSLVQDGLESKKPRQRRRRNGGIGAASTDGGIMSHLARHGSTPSTPEPSTTAQSTRSTERLALSDASTEQSAQPLESKTPAGSSNADAVGPQTTPPETRRVLKLNPKTGTLGSPLRPNQAKSPSRIVRIRYGHDEESRQAIGYKVTQILDGKLQIPSIPTKKREDPASGKTSDPSAKQDDGPKPTHPFFTGRVKPAAPEKDEAAALPNKVPTPRYSVFMSTPISSKNPWNSFASSCFNRMPQIGIMPPGAKIPGAMHPMWPAAGMSHVRGEDAFNNAVERAAPKEELPRKSKGHVTTVMPRESILTLLVGRMNLDAVRNSLPKDENSFEPAPAELRLPQRHFESGRELQERIRPQLEASPLAAPTSTDDSSQDELSADPPPQIHPAIVRHYRLLETQLSAYDKSSCESLTWTQKYAPTTAAQVLQTGKETALLKQWLEALKVQSVENGGDTGGERARAKSESAPKKKKRKAKLDGFIVNSDDETSEMDELSDGEDEESLAGTGLLKKSVISSKDQGRLKNTIVISGPHGCGKTAAVYAVAKELDFEIFEINPSSRRSGKDILEKVEDMTRNHLVQQHRAQPVSAGGEDEVAEDVVKSGKQGTMTAFFKPKPATTGGQKAGKRPKEKSEKAPKSSLPKSQRQSLILVEEADVLYEEDKQFWAMLMGMMAQSKRPFVVTCNDESLVPTQSLGLYGIFRFSPPPPSLAVDVCLLIAANEGHALGRTAVESLYRSRGNDLRATICELNYWCQMGIGDRRGGFDWFYSRWPKGSDVDEKGDVVRVVSEGSYLEGMGWIGRDVMATASEPLAMEEEVMHQAWDSWRVDMGDWHTSPRMEAMAREASSPSPPTARIKVLAAYEEFCGAMSEADICSSGALGAMLQERIDPTLPDLPSSIKDDFIIGRILLEADPATFAASPSTAISMSVKSLARETLHGSAAGRGNPSAVEAVEGKAISVLDSSFRTRRHQLTRRDIAQAFDPIAFSPKAQPSTHLEPSVFDRPMKLVVADVAPWVRGIVAFEHQLMLERLKLSNLLSTGRRKRMRTTRSAYSALEGGERRTTRRERYFGNCLTTGAVMRTGAESFQKAGCRGEGGRRPRCAVSFA